MAIIIINAIINGEYEEVSTIYYSYIYLFILYIYMYLSVLFMYLLGQKIPHSIR